MNASRYDEPRINQPDGNDDGIDFTDPMARQFCHHGNDVTEEYDSAGKPIRFRVKLSYRCPECKAEEIAAWNASQG